ncbi:hypothetical protein QUB68_07460 [Microcoleus sp. A006_D1]|uniref:hypothetical protein n=1 Tax=Microcoleus sp. A006_D1 TaxID=3055267 RepID=UPI002FD745D4
MHTCIEMGLAVEIISTVSAVRRFIKYLCSAIDNGWHQKVYHRINPNLWDVALSSVQNPQ